MLCQVTLWAGKGLNPPVERIILLGRMRIGNRGRDGKTQILLNIVASL